MAKKKLHGSFTKKADAEKRASENKGAKVRKFKTARGVRYVVMSEK